MSINVYLTFHDWEGTIDIMRRDIMYRVRTLTVDLPQTARINDAGRRIPIGRKRSTVYHSTSR